MPSSIFFPRKPVPPELLSEYARRYPDLDPSAVQTFFRLLQVAIRVINVTDEQLAAQKTSRGKLSVLGQLEREPSGAMTPSQLADEIGVTRATITGLLDGLERDGMLQREEGKDARSILVRLTAKGRRFLESVLPDRYRRIRSLMRGLGEDDRRRLRELLDRVEKGLPSFGGK